MAGVRDVLALVAGLLVPCVVLLWALLGPSALQRRVAWAAVGVLGALEWRHRRAVARTAAEIRDRWRARRRLAHSHLHHADLHATEDTNWADGPRAPDPKPHPAAASAQPSKLEQPVSTTAAPFPHVEMLRYVRGAQDAGLVRRLFSPLLGFRPLEACSDAELEALVQSLVSLHGPAAVAQSEAVPAALGRELGAYALKIVAEVRRHVPRGAYQPPASTGHAGTDFWERDPVYFAGPWLFNSLLSLHDSLKFWRARRAGRVHVVHDPGSVPVWVRPGVAGARQPGDTDTDADTRDGNPVPVLMFHGATTKFVAVQLIASSVPAEHTVYAPLFTPLWYYGTYDDGDGHLLSVDEYWLCTHRWLQARGITELHVLAWSLGCLLASGFLRRYGHLYTVRSQVYVEPLGSPLSCTLAYALSTEPLSASYAALLDNGGAAVRAKTFGLALFLKHFAPSRCYWKLLPFRNVLFDRHPRIDTPATLVLVSANDPITHYEHHSGWLASTLYPSSTIVEEPGMHGAWVFSPRLGPFVGSWLRRASLAGLR